VAKARRKKGDPPLEALPCVWVLAQEGRPTPDMPTLMRFIGSFHPSAEKLDTYVSQELPHIRVLEYLYDTVPDDVRHCTKTEAWEAAFVLCQRLRKEAERMPAEEGVTSEI
jgi:hypothetical protein